MEYEWDEAKRRSNLAKHGFDFRDDRRFHWDDAALVEVQHVDGEVREVWIGPLPSRFVVIVSTDRAGRRRLISMRPAKGQDMKRWTEHVRRR